MTKQRKHADIGAEVGTLVAEKQAAYGDSFGRAGEVLRILYPEAIPPEAYDDVLFIARVLDKLFRIATSAGAGDPMAEDPARDIVGYALLQVARREAKR